MIRFISILLLSVPVVTADVKINHIIVGAKPDMKVAVESLQADKGSVAIDWNMGAVVLKDCTPEEVAKLLFDIIEAKLPAKQPIEQVKIECIQFGKVGMGEKCKGIRVNVLTGEINWPGIVELDKESRLVWDAYVLEFKKRYPDGK